MRARNPGLCQGTDLSVPQDLKKSKALAPEVQISPPQMDFETRPRTMLFSQETLMKLHHRTLNYLLPILFLLLGTILPRAQAQLTPGRIPKITSTFPRFRIADSLISEDGSGIHIGAMSIAPTGVITLCCGQNFGDGAWSLSGNSGTGCTTSPCSNFLGTTDNTSVEIRVNGQRAYRIEPATSSVSGVPPGFAPNIIAGNSNYVTAGASGATIAGGGSAVNLDSVNSVTDDFGTVSGGFGNRAGDAAGTTGDTPFATVAGGYLNTASGYASAVTRGSSNTPSGTDVTASADNQFVARASGGVIFYTTPDLSAGASLSPGSGSWSSLSDRNVKANFAQVDRRQLLTRVLALPISTWNYKTQAESIRHIGPMAQDFYAAFNIGEDDKHITTIDEGSIALAAIQGLYEIVKVKDM